MAPIDPRNVIHLRPPIAREEPEDDPPVAGFPPVTDRDRLDTVIADVREILPRVRRIDRRTRRTLQVAIGSARTVRRLERLALDAAELDGRIVAELARGPVRRAASGASVRTLGGAIGTGLVVWFSTDPVGCVAFWRSVFGG